MSGLRSIITELHRRSLWQVLGIYLGGSWIALQVVDNLTENVGLPSWFPGLALGLLVIGLPIVLATAFVQEGAPRVGGDDSTSPSARSAAAALDVPAAAETKASRLLTWRNAILGGVAAFALWGVVATAWLVLGANANPIGGGSNGLPSIAVLPFQNLSGDAENAYFADGVHEEILTRLAKIEALRVISRTSVMEYRGSEMNLRQIGEELGVGAILEGSVRRSGDQVRITAQLIDAETDEHLWAESYDRSIADIFAIQADVAQQIAAALHAELRADDRRELEERPTEDMAAYEDYLRAREIENRGRSAENLAAAQRLYARAIERDPSFLTARGRMAWSHLLTYWLGFDRSPSRVERAREQVAYLEANAPDAPETHYAKAYLLYYAEHDYAAAARAFEQALDVIPDARFGLSYVQRRMGQWEDHIRNLEMAWRDSPRDHDLPRNLAETFSMLRRFDEAERTFRETIELSPTAADAYLQLAHAHLRQGEVAEAGAVLDEMRALNLTYPSYVVTRVDVDLARGDHAAAMAAIDASGEPFVVSQPFYMPLAQLRASVLTAMGDAAGAQEAYAEAERQLQPVVAERPWDPRVWLALADARSGLGRSGPAHDAIARLRELYPLDRDRMLGPALELNLAAIHTRLGERDAALDILERLIDVPAPVTPALLRIDPTWNSLRNEPRFQALVR